ncbi:MAG: hypothetical protein LBS85_03855 [Clostridiales Family XIII bacterium]|jgi:hypothetical protein|nr:hypothetical protein [Clostridiales Family XIII bacterium]
MLSKLIKLEFKATARTFFFVYAALIIITAVNLLIFPWDSLSDPVPNILQGIVMFLYIVAVIAAGFVTAALVITRFFRNMLGDEGYLMHTLPAAAEQLILAKFITSIVWSVCTGALVALSILAFGLRTGVMSQIRATLDSWQTLGYSVGSWEIGMIGLVFVSAAAGILLIYAAMAIGPNLLKNKVGGSILAFIILAVGAELVSVPVGQIFAATGTEAGLIASILKADSATAGAGGFFESAAGIDLINQSVPLALASQYAISIIIGVVCWFLTRYFLKKKLNLA